MQTYPTQPGFKEHTTSREAAKRIAPEVQRIRHLVLGFIMNNPGHTADEIAERLAIDKGTVRPRCSELRTKDLIEPTGVRKKNNSGASAHCWRVKEDRRDIGELAAATRGLF